MILRMNRKTSQIFNVLLLTGYLSYLALPLIHYHPQYNSDRLVYSESKKKTHYVDPFSNSDSGCTLNQLIVLHINVNKKFYNSEFYYAESNYSSQNLSAIPLQDHEYNSGLRAPPITS